MLLAQPKEFSHCGSVEEFPQVLYVLLGLLKGTSLPYALEVLVCLLSFLKGTSLSYILDVLVSVYLRESLSQLLPIYSILGFVF